MFETILVIVEQQQGKLNRVSYETLTGAQAIAAATGWTVEAAVAGGANVGSVASEVAGKRLRRSMRFNQPSSIPTRPTHSPPR